MIEIDTGEVQALRADLLRSQAVLDDETTKAVDQIAVDVLAAARKKVPSRSGAARASLKVAGSAGAVTLTGGSGNARYYGWLDFGGRVGRRGTTSRLYKRGGRYIYPALASLDSEISRTLERAVDKTLKAGGFSG